jgi:hypothetical protein
LALVAPSGVLGRIAANERPQLNDVNEIVSLAAELVCNHREVGSQLLRPL